MNWPKPLTLALLTAAPIASEEPNDTTVVPRQAIAGVSGFSSRSSVLFDEAPDRPHSLDTVYLFPDRVRWLLRAQGGDPTARVIFYRFGGDFFRIDEGSGASRVLLDEPRLAAERELEMRRALMMWPDGFEWTGTGDERRADLGQAGSLRATVDASGRPLEIAGYSRRDLRGESLAAVAWHEEWGRQWPAQIEFRRADGTRVWTETVDAIEVSPTFLDLFFRPPDQRVHWIPAGPGRARSIDLPERTERRIPLLPELDWAEWLLACDEHVRREGERLLERGLALAEGYSIEIGDDGRPTHCVLRLESALDPAPRGWKTRGATPAITRVHGDFASLGEAAIRELIRAAPPGSRPGRPYLRLGAVPPEGKGRTVQIVVPLLP